MNEYRLFCKKKKNYIILYKYNFRKKEKSQKLSQQKELRGNGNPTKRLE
jgi:hypothetical protein